MNISIYDSKVEIKIFHGTSIVSEMEMTAAWTDLTVSRSGIRFMGIGDMEIESTDDDSIVLFKQDGDDSARARISKTGIGKTADFICWLIDTYRL